MNWIVFALHGKQRKYTEGFLRNLDLIPRAYGSGWAVALYYDISVPAAVIRTAMALRLVALNRVDQTPFSHWGRYPGRFWRLLALVDSDVNCREGSRVCFRDADSRVSAREVEAVNDWVRSGRKFHIMRDHPNHSARKMLAGMWGYRVGAKSLSWIADETEKHCEERLRLRIGAPWSNDFFLGRSVYHRIKEDAWEHDSFAGRAFPTGTHPGPFVGEVVDIDETGQDVPREPDRMARDLAVDKLHGRV